MSVTQTFTVTVVSGNPSNHPYHNFGSTNKYAIDGSTATADVTLTLAEGGTYRFDQSDSSNSAHPLRFSTTANGTHSGGSEYTTGVTTNGTPGQAGAYTQITVADDAPTLYYYCTNHSGMGWTANTDIIQSTFTVTVVSTGSGNKYFINGTQQATLELVEGATFRLDQSDSSNGNHPLRFSTTSNGTHSGGSEYTTGVNTSGTPGSSGAYTQITVAADAPTLYYYCTNHSGMGGQANTPNADFWGAGNWSANLWGIEDAFTLGWGAQAWNDSEWGELNDATFSVTGVSSTSSIGSVSVETEINTGWGQDEWGEENWGQSGITVSLTGVEATTSIGEDVSWGKQTWDSATTGWSGEYYLEVADVMGLSGVSATSTVGSPTAKSDVTLVPSGQSATSSIGSVEINFNINVSITGVNATSSVGALTPADVMGLSGLGATSNIGDLTTSGNPNIDVTGVSATSSVGTLNPADVMGLTGVSASSSAGSLSVRLDPLVILDGQLATSNVALFGTSSGFGIQAYSDVDTGSNSSYTSVATGSNTSYTDAA